MSGAVRHDERVVVAMALRVMDHGGIELLIDPLELESAMRHHCLSQQVRDAVDDAVSRDDVHLALWPSPTSVDRA